MTDCLSVFDSEFTSCVTEANRIEVFPRPKLEDVIALKIVQRPFGHSLGETKNHYHRSGV